MVRVEGLRLAARPVQSEHQEPAQPLPQRIFGDQRLDLRDRVGVVAQRNLRFESALERQHPQLLETRGNRHEVGLISEIRESRPAPECKRLSERRGRLFSPTRFESDTAFVCQPFEVAHVETTRLDSNHVARPARFDRLLP